MVILKTEWKNVNAESRLTAVNYLNYLHNILYDNNME